MPSDSRRRIAVEAVVTLFKTITPGVTYSRDLTVGDNVSMVPKLREEQVRDGKSFVWVRPGIDIWEPAEISPADLFNTEFEILADAVIKNKLVNTSVVELEDLIQDLGVAIGNDRTLGGVVDDLRLRQVDPPSYGVNDILAIATLHIECQMMVDHRTLA